MDHGRLLAAVSAETACTQLRGLAADYGVVAVEHPLDPRQCPGPVRGTSRRGLSRHPYRDRAFVGRAAASNGLIATAAAPACSPAMPLSFLEFEQPIAELEAKIDELQFVSSDAEVNVGEEIARLRAKSRALTTSIFANLTPWQVAQLARHPQRPYTLDYAATIFDEFQRTPRRPHVCRRPGHRGRGRAARRRAGLLIGHQKGRDTKERVRRNYGMPKPEGYRKALRLMRMAERFRLPIITLIDTPGAYPGVGSEERNQSEAIARNLFEMSHAAGADHHGGYWRRRLRWRARDWRLRSAAHAAVLSLFGDLTGRLRVDPLEKRRQERDRGRGDGHHGRTARQARSRR